MKTQINNTLLFAAIFLAGFGSKTLAQGSTPANQVQKFKIGFKVSPNFSWTRIMEGNMKNNAMGLGFSYGVMADFNLGGNASYWFGTELIITSQPSSVKSTDTLYNATTGLLTNAKFDYRLQYVQIPLTLKLRTAEIGRLTWFGQFGIAPSVLIQNKLSTSGDQGFYAKGTSGHAPNSSKNDVFDFAGKDNKGAFEDNVRFLRIPLVVGAGIEGKISGNTRFMAGLKLDNAFTDMFVDKGVKGRNNYIALNLGIFF